MNETFEIEDEKPDKDTSSGVMNQHQQTNEDKRRESILLIENNFEIMNNEHSMRKNSLLGGYLEFEEMPDFLLDDCITETNTSNVTVQLKGENNNNHSLLGELKFLALFFVFKRFRNEASLFEMSCLFVKNFKFVEIIFL
jgi:hypothetical protein